MPSGGVLLYCMCWQLWRFTYILMGSCCVSLPAVPLSVIRSSGNTTNYHKSLWVYLLRLSFFLHCCPGLVTTYQTWASDYSSCKFESVEIWACVEILVWISSNSPLLILIIVTAWHTNHFHNPPQWHDRPLTLLSSRQPRLPWLCIVSTYCKHTLLYQQMSDSTRYYQIKGPFFAAQTKSALESLKQQWCLKYCVYFCLPKEHLCFVCKLSRLFDRGKI